MAVVDRPTTTVDAGGWTESSDPVGPATPETPPPAQGTNGADASGATLESVEADEANEPPRRPNGRFEKNGFRRRAHSQQATAEDVPRIQALTKRLREVERERDTLRGGSPASSNGNGATVPHTSTPPAPPATEAPAPPRPAARSVHVPPPPPPFDMREPTYEDFANSPDPLRDYTKAMAKFTHAEQQHELAVRYQQQQAGRASEQATTQFQEMTQEHWGRMNQIATDPAYKPLVEQFRNDTRPITPAVLEAIVRSGENSAKLTIAMLQTPGLLDELTLATYDRPATPELVAVVQRRLQSLGLSAATTGSVTVPSVKPAPRPPNPVRTAPDAPPSELPGDDASLADHAAAFHRPRRSRLRRD